MRFAIRDTARAVTKVFHNEGGTSSTPCVRLIGRGRRLGSHLDSASDGRARW
jgi:hypothetical protein